MLCSCERGVSRHGGRRLATRRTGDRPLEIRCVPKSLNSRMLSKHRMTDILGSKAPMRALPMVAHLQASAGRWRGRIARLVVTAVLSRAAHEFGREGVQCSASSCVVRPRGSQIRGKGDVFTLGQPGQRGRLGPATSGPARSASDLKQAAPCRIRRLMRSVVDELPGEISAGAWRSALSQP